MSHPTQRAGSRLLFVNRSYWPCAEATGQLLTELCEDLSDRFDITVIAGQPNQNPENVPFRARGVEEHRGVRIHRVWNSRFPKRSLSGKACNLLTYLAGASLAAFGRIRPDAVIVETDPPLLCLLGALLQRWRRAKLVVYLQDVYPDLAVALGKLPDAFWTRWLRKLFFAVYRRADRVVVLSHEMRRLLIESGVSPERVVVVPNWVDTRRVQPQKDENRLRARYAGENQFVVMYSGNLGLCQRLEDLIEAAALLQDRTDIRFVLVGDGASRRPLEARVAELNLPNVAFFPYQPQQMLAESLSAADLHVVSLDPRVVGFLMPSKLYGALASGTAVLSIAPEHCDMSEVVRAAAVGLVAEPNRPESVAAAIRWAAEHRDELAEMGRRGWHLAQDEYDRARQTSRFGEMLEQMLRGELPVVEVTPTPPSTVTQSPVTQPTAEPPAATPVVLHEIAR
jgi:glycosyltransferase involved in cell wall biosynthesis